MQHAYRLLKWQECVCARALAVASVRACVRVCVCVCVWVVFGCVCKYVIMRVHECGFSLDRLLWHTVAAEDQLHYVPTPGIKAFSHDCVCVCVWKRVSMCITCMQNGHVHHQLMYSEPPLFFTWCSPPPKQLPQADGHRHTCVAEK